MYDNPLESADTASIPVSIDHDQITQVAAGIRRTEVISSGNNLYQGPAVLPVGVGTCSLDIFSCLSCLFFLLLSVRWPGID